MKVEITFIEEVLGTLAGDPEVATEFILSKAEKINGDESAALPSPDEALENATTVFAKEDGKPFLWDYQFRGFFKAAGSAWNRAAEKKADQVAAHKKIVDQIIFVKPRKIFLDLAGELTFCERPIRVSGPKGERVSLVRSEAAPAGTKANFEIYILGNDDKFEPIVRHWLDYGQFSGMGQWRNSGKGSFTWREFE